MFQYHIYQYNCMFKWLKTLHYACQPNSGRCHFVKKHYLRTHLHTEHVICIHMTSLLSQIYEDNGIVFKKSFSNVCIFRAPKLCWHVNEQPKRIKVFRFLFIFAGMHKVNSSHSNASTTIVTYGYNKHHFHSRLHSGENGISLAMAQSQWQSVDERPKCRKIIQLMCFGTRWWLEKYGYYIVKYR